MTKITANLRPSAMDFIADMMADKDIRFIRAYLPSSHPLVKRHKVQQIRNPKGIMVEAWDVLGNSVVLTTKGNVLQLIGGEKLPAGL